MAAPPASPAAGGRDLRGAFITFEGIDGCGKTTQALRLAERLRAAGHDVLQTREPGGTAFGQELRSLLLASRSDIAGSGPGTGLAPETQLLLFLADRLQHLAEVIRPALAAGRVVICDRYHDATVAYQHYGRGLDLAPLQGFIDREILSTPPHLTLLLDLDVAAARARTHTGQMPARQLAFLAEGEGEAAAPGGRRRLTAAEQAELAFYERVRQGYLALQRADPERMARIDADQGPEAVAGAVWRAVAGRFGLEG